MINNEWSMYKYARPSKRKQERTSADHMRNYHGIKQPEESPKNAEAMPRQTDHTPRQAGR